MKNLERIAPQVAALCHEQPAILAAYIFGSVARGNANDGSDVDVAVLLDQRKAAEFSLLSWMALLEERLECQVDVVVLNKANELLKYEVRRTGTLIFDRAPDQRKRFDILSRKAYEDFLYLHRRYVNAVLYGKKTHG